MTLTYLIRLIKVFKRIVNFIDKFLIDLYLWKQGSRSSSQIMMELMTSHDPDFEFRIFIVKAPISTSSSKSMVKPTGFATVEYKECLTEFQEEK